MKEIDFNVNSFVKVRLTDIGRKIYKENWEPEFIELGLECQPPKEDADGWSEWQLWQLLGEFGRKSWIGSGRCFETNIKILLFDEGDF